MKFKNYGSFLTFLRNAGRSEQVNEALYKYLTAQGQTEGNLHEKLRDFLEGLGYTGQMSKMMSDWASDDFAVSAYSVSIGTGAFTTGTLLTASVSGLVGGETVTYQWTDDGGNITGATSSTYTPAIGTDGIADASQINVSVTVDGGDPFTASNREIRYAAGSVTESALADWTIDDDVLNVSLVSDFTTTNLTGSYVIASLPAGAVDDGDGTISGTATGSPATTAFTCTFTDQYGRTIVGSYSIDTVYRTQATAADALGPYSWTVDDDTVNINAVPDFTVNGNTLTYVITGLPTGLSDDTDGTWSGTPTVDGQAGTITITGTDEYGRQTTSTPTFSTAYRTQATAASGLGPYSFEQDSAITAQNLAADFTLNGNTLTYAITGTALPASLVVSSAGSMSGTPNDITASASYTVRGTDEYGRTTDSSFTLEITDVTGTITVSNISYTRGAAGVAPVFSFTTSDTNTNPNYTMYVASRDSADAELSKTNIQNGTGNAIEDFDVGPTATLAGLSGQDLDLNTSLTADNLDFYIIDSTSGTPVESDVYTVGSVDYDAVAPAYSSAVVENADPDSLVLTLDKNSYVAQGETLAHTDFTLGGVIGGLVTGVTRTSATTYTFTLSRDVVNGEAGTIALTAGTLVGIDAEDVSFTAQTITNNVAAASSWDFEDDFTGYSNGDVLNAQSAYDQVYRNNASAVMEVSTTPSVQIHSDGTQYPYEIVAHTGRTYTDDQRAEVDVETGPGSDDYTIAVGVRLDSVNNEGYVVEWFDGSSTSLQVKKITGIGTLSNLGSAITITAPTLPFSLALEARDNGANVDLEVFIDGVSEGTVTDTSSVYTDGDAGFGQYMNADDSASQGDAAGAISDFRARDA